MILADEPHLMLYEVKDPQSLPTWPRENSLPNQLRQSVITLCATYKEISCSGQSLVLQRKAVNNNEKKTHTETFVPCAREERKRNLPWSSSEKLRSVNCLNVKLLPISFWVECFPIKERDEKGKLSRPELSWSTDLAARKQLLILRLNELNFSFCQPGGKASAVRCLLQTDLSPCSQIIWILWILDTPHPDVCFPVFNSHYSPA